MEVKEPSAKYLARPSYQQTEVGPIPGDWTLRNLADLSAFITKGSTPTTYGFSWLPDGVLFLRSECVSENGLDLSQSKYISDAAHASLRRSQICDGDLLITITGNVGRVILFRNPGNANINQHIARVRITAPEASRDFVYHYLTLPRCRKRFTSITTGQAYPQISLKQVREAPIPLPFTRAEQEAIAEALNDADAFVESLEQVLAKKRQLKQGAMQELLTGMRRLPGFESKRGHKQTELGLIPEDWGVSVLGDVTDCLDSLRVPLNEAQRAKRSGDIPYCGANGVLDYIDDFVVDDDIILIAEDGGYFDEYMTRPIAYRMTGKCWVNNHAHILKAKVGTDQAFIHFSLIHKNILRFLASGTRAKLNRSELDKIEISLPPTKAEQEAIATILAVMDAEIAALEAKVAKARQVKQGMMQELLTGRIRLV